eukprot:1794173-Prymnesium_polylepis.1
MGQPPPQGGSHTLTLMSTTSCLGGSHGASVERRRDTYGRVPMKICVGPGHSFSFGGGWGECKGLY